MEQAEDEVYERLDYELEAAGSRGMIVSFVGSIAMILLLATGYSTKYIESLNGSGIMWFLLEILTFIALEVYLNVWQIRYVRVIQKIYPDKKGDPTSLKFPKQCWKAAMSRKGMYLPGKLQRLSDRDEMGADPDVCGADPAYVF